MAKGPDDDTLVFVLPKTLKAALRNRAADRDRSIGSYLRQMIRRDLKKHNIAI